MLTDVLQAACGVPFLRRLVVTESDAIRRIARAAGVETLDAPLSTMNGAVTVGLRAASLAGATGAVVLAADLPLLESTDIELVLTAAERAAIVIAPDRRRRGTNGLALTPPLVIAPAFGDGSYRRHTERVRMIGAEISTVTTPGLATDVDDREDLAFVRGAASLGAHTAAFLAGHGG